MGDRWIKTELNGFLQWARTQNSLLILTWVEAEDASSDNRIPLVFAGPIATPGRYSEPVNAYRLLRTLEDMYHLAPTGRALPRRSLN